jgi:two-component system response regulator FlrC
MSQANVLVVEDDRELREALCTTLQLAGMDFIAADCGDAALRVLERRPVDIIVSDVNMPGMDGHELLAQVRRAYPAIPMLLITAYGQIRMAVDAMQNGAADYLVKPFEPQILIQSITRILGLGTEDDDRSLPVAEDPFTRQFFDMARRVAEADSTVMISGESGTGKEVLARFIHQRSSRRNKPFVAINCAAIPENMLEAMLFGHEKGAFTGAYNSSPGKFEQANGGTLLLDEISEMDLGLQAKLLRVLQEREVERVGGRKAIPLDVRVLATTNRDLREYVQEGKFREDLYYRLSVIPMHWKPLRERPLDIWPLAERLLAEHAGKMKRRHVRFAAGMEQALRCYRWPGNVRELDNAIQRALILCHGDTIRPEDLHLEQTAGMVCTRDEPVHVQQPAQAVQFDLDDERSALGQDLRQREYQIIIETLKQERGRKKQAAEKLGISPRTLRYKLAQMRELGIDLAHELSAA